MGQERAQMPRLEKRYINQRKLTLEVVFKAPIGPCASAERRVELDFREGEVYLFFLGVGPVSGQGWAQERAQMTRLEKVT